MSKFLGSQRGRIEKIRINLLEELDIISDSIAAYLKEAGGRIEAYVLEDQSSVLLGQLLITSFAAAEFRNIRQFTLTVANEWIRKHRQEFPYLKEAIDNFETAVYWAIAYDCEWTEEEMQILQMEMTEVHFKPDCTDLDGRVEEYVFQWLRATYEKP